jgi:glycosyltransferase involved in cell wall biosynthesis
MDTSPPGPQRIRILHLLTRLLKGGSDEHTLATLEGCTRDRYEFALAYGPDHDPEQVARAEKAGVRTRCFPGLVNWPAPRTDPGLMLALARWMRQEGFDIVHTHQTKAGIVGRLSARLAGTPCIVHTCHGFGYGALGSALKDRAMLALERRCGRWTHSAVYVSGYLMQQGFELGLSRPERSTVIRSGKDIARYRGPSAERARREASFGREGRPLTIACTTRLAEGKGIEDLIDAVAVVAPEFSGLRLWIVGEGPLRSALEERIAARGLSEVASLLGFRSDVPELLAEVDIVVLVSLREGLPQSLTEAMIAGKAVVATPVGGIPEVVRDRETGLLVPPADAQRLAGALRELLANDELRRSIGERAATELGVEFSRSRMLEQYDALYADLYARHVAPKKRPATAGGTRR